MIRYGIDLGADHIRLISGDEGIIFDEPCMIAYDKRNRVLAIGEEAKEMKTLQDSNVKVISPLDSKEINFDALADLVENMCYMFKVFRVFSKTELVFCYPTSLTKDQCEELKQNLLDLGASRVYFDQEIWMSAIGADLDLFLPVSSCVLNIGSSNCDIAIFSSGQMQAKSTNQLAGKHINILIGNWLLQNYDIIVSEFMKEKIKYKLGHIGPVSQVVSMQVQGIDAKTRQMKVVTITNQQVSQLLEQLVQGWEKWILDFIETLSDAQKDDIHTRGIVCCGGTMLQPGIQKHFQNVLQCPIFITDNPRHTVTRGLKSLLNRME